MHKRLLSIILAVLSCLFVVGCNSDNSNNPSDQGGEENVLYVDVIDVGQGDAILVCFPNGDTLMIDCGSGSSFANHKIENVLTKRKVNRIDYLVLTHPDIDHVGGASFVANEVEIGRIFLPYIYYIDNFPAYKSAKESLEQKCDKKTYSAIGLAIEKEGYFIKFLSPANKEDSDSSYHQINRFEPTDSQTNNVSPIIYVECNGIRMLFTGDAESGQEKYVLNNYLVGLYSGSPKINLYDIDLLKVAHHGSNDSTSTEFVEMLKPKNAVFSVGGDNIYGHPYASVIERILTANPNCNILRTDYLGTISFTIKDGVFTRI